MTTRVQIRKQLPQLKRTRQQLNMLDKSSKQHCRGSAPKGQPQFQNQTIFGTPKRAGNISRLLCLEASIKIANATESLNSSTRASSRTVTPPSTKPLHTDLEVLASIVFKLAKAFGIYQTTTTQKQGRHLGNARCAHLFLRAQRKRAKH